MRNLNMLIGAAALVLAGAVLHANDTWEPNNTPAQAADFLGHIAPSATIAGFNIGLGGQNGRAIRDQLVISGTDVDYFRIGGLATVPDGTMFVYLNQTNHNNHRLSVQIMDDAGVTVLAGPATAGYAVLDSGQLDHYDGVRVQTAVTAGSQYLIRVYHTGSLPGGVSVNYELSVEFGTRDAADGTYSNNFPGYAPRPNYSHPADATPSGYGAGNSTFYQGMTWRGWDYYLVTLTAPGRITVDLDNFQNLANASVNFDLYWVRETGGMIPVHTGGGALMGASDSFPNGWPNNGQLTVVTNPNSSEQIVTPPLAPGNYYFQVFAWNLSNNPPGVGFYHAAGSYDIRFTLSAETDDAYEPNNTAQDAAQLTLTGTTTNISNLTLLFDPDGNEVDWYKVTLQDGDNLDVRLNVDAPATDHMNIHLYRPSANPGSADDLIDSSLINNTETASKGGPTASEIVGTWGTVGPSGNTGLPVGDYLIRVSAGSFQRPLINQGYSLTIRRNATGMINIAPDDAYEPNNSVAQVSDPNNTHVVLPRGLTTNLKSMNFQDWYRVPNVNRTHTVEVTMTYDGDANTDLDLVVFDLNFGPNFAQGGISALAGDFANENTPASVVTVNAVAGATYAAGAAPNSGAIYIVVQRWNSYGATYSLNVNINGQNPLPPLRMNSVQANPAALTAGNATTVTVEVENVSANDVDLTALGLTFMHTSGANVTSQYNVTGPVPALPFTIPANSTENFVFDVLADAAATNGSITISVSAQAGTTAVLGSPTAVLTLTGGQDPAPLLVYQATQTSGSLTPGGILNVSVQVRNNGTLGGTYSDTPPIDIAFTRGGADITPQFTGTGSTQPALPLTVAIGQTVSVSWTFQISQSLPLGPVTVEVSGGGPENPTGVGQGQFNIGLPSSAKPGGGGGGCAVTAPALPLLLVVGALLALRRRRR